MLRVLFAAAVLLALTPNDAARTSNRGSATFTDSAFLAWTWARRDGISGGPIETEDARRCDRKPIETLGYYA